MLTKVTWLPRTTVMFFGLTASLAITIVVVLVPPPGDGVGDGDEEVLELPHAIRSTQAAAAIASAHRR